MKLTWELKLFALQMLCKNTHLEMSEPKNWYVSNTNRHIAKDGILYPEFGTGRSPEEAVENDWAKLVDNLPANASIRIYDANSGQPPRFVRWDGWGWIDVPTPEVYKESK